MLGNIDSILKNCGIKYQILIDDVQEAIEEENVPLTMQMQIELEGRKGLRLSLQLYRLKFVIS